MPAPPDEHVVAHAAVDAVAAGAGIDTVVAAVAIDLVVGQAAHQRFTVLGSGLRAGDPVAVEAQHVRQVAVVVVPSSFWNSNTMSMGGGGGTAPAATSGGSMLNTIPSLPPTPTTKVDGTSNEVGAPSWTVISDERDAGAELDEVGYRGIDPGDQSVERGPARYPSPPGPASIPPLFPE